MRDASAGDKQVRGEPPEGGPQGETPEQQSPPIVDPTYKERRAAASIDSLTYLEIVHHQLVQTIPALNQRAKSLGVHIAWFWTVYSSTALASTVFGETSSGAGGIVLIAPVISALIAYFMAVHAQAPLVIAFDTSNLDACREAVTDAIKVKQFRIKMCLASLGLTGILIATGVAAAYG